MAVCYELRAASEAFNSCRESERGTQKNHIVQSIVVCRNSCTPYTFQLLVKCKDGIENFQTCDAECREKAKRDDLQPWHTPQQQSTPLLQPRIRRSPIAEFAVLKVAITIVLCLAT